MNDYLRMAGYGQPDPLGPIAAPIVQSPVSQQLMPDAGIGPAPTGGLMDWLEQLNAFGKTDLKTGIHTGGWAAPAAGLAQSVLNAFMGMKQFGLAKKALAENKRQFNLNYDAQRSMTNAALEDRQRARLAANPGAYQSVGDYMNRYGIK